MVVTHKEHWEIRDTAVQINVHRRVNPIQLTSVPSGNVTVEYAKTFIGVLEKAIEIAEENRCSPEVPTINLT